MYQEKGWGLSAEHGAGTTWMEEQALPGGTPGHRDVPAPHHPDC